MFRNRLSEADEAGAPCPDALWLYGGGELASLVQNSVATWVSYGTAWSEWSECAGALQVDSGPAVRLQGGA